MPEQLPPHLPEPEVAEPAPGLHRPDVVRWEFFTVRSEREIGVVFPRGVATRLHSVDVDERPDEVVVTVRVGTLPDIGPDVVVPAVAYLETALVHLRDPLGDRPLVVGGG